MYILIDPPGLLDRKEIQRFIREWEPMATEEHPEVQDAVLEAYRALDLNIRLA
jgi:hypothetical protein